MSGELVRAHKIIAFTGLGLVAAFGAAAAPATSPSTGTYTTIHQFTGGSDGATPSTPLTLDTSGNLYGGTSHGGDVCTMVDGSQGCGTIYKISAGGQLSTLVTFDGANGQSAGTALTLIGQTLYGGTSGGGQANGGVLFAVNTDGTGYKILHQFSGPDGFQPTGRLLQAPQGGFYGITNSGGPNSANLDGVLYYLLPNGFVKVLHVFRESDGIHPNYIVRNKFGTIYGSTSEGGAGNCRTGCGTVYSYVPSTGQFTVIYQFQNKSDGSLPILGSIDPNGTLYGVTQFGGGSSYFGTMFSLVPESSGYALNELTGFDQTNGSDPSTGPTLTNEGTLIGTTNGEAYPDFPTLYFYDTKLKKRLVTLYTWNDTQAVGLYIFGSQPVVGSSGVIYGTTGQGGTTKCYSTAGGVIQSGCGVAYSFARPGLAD